MVNNKPNWTFRINQVIAHHLKYKQKLSLREFDISFDRLINESNCSSASVQLMLLLKDLSISEIEIILEHFEFSGKSEMQFPKMMNEKDLIQCETEGVQIGSHGFTHILLNDYRSEMELNHEIADSKKMLESMLHHEISSFAFPAGMHGERLKEYAFQAGYQFLFIVDDMLCPISFLVPESIVFPRIIIPTLGSNEALLKIEGFHSGLKKWRTA